MSRPNKVWFRKDIGWWMVTLGGRKVRLAQGRKNRKAAEQKFYELKAAEAVPTHNGDARVADIIDSFLAWSKLHRSAETCRNHVWYGQKFAEHIGYLKATELRPNHLTQWVDTHEWGQTTQRNARRSIYRAFAWAVEEGLLTSNPLNGMKCPGALARRRAMSDGEFRAVLKASKRDFKVLMFSLRMTGCRPKEARTLRWEQVLEDRWVLPQHKTVHKTGQPRVVYLTPPMQKLMAVLRRQAKQDHVFLNQRGQPWTRNAVRLRMDRLKKKLGLPSDLCCYHARHAFGTSAVLNGVDVMTVAQLMGHSSLEMISRVYVHLAGQHDHLAAAAQRAARSPASSKPPPGALRPAP
jgi:integrase